ncbi:hypothetical protein GIB67_036014, partial [Kingdonia uniflora]
LGIRLKNWKIVRTTSEVVLTKIALGPKFQRIVKWSFERPHDSFKRLWLCLFVSKFVLKGI